ncbi:SpoIIE family protein phosphatase [Nonomuraea salmonea]|uniref:SpoIIE family protein phosphatase n=1 Tax=Nonomuraea salmonea TaxID=46181 RepID=A0ABV5NQD2_9ACTN
MSVPPRQAHDLTLEGGRPLRLRDLKEAGAYVVDDRGRIIEVNPNAERLLLRRAGDLLDHDAHDALHRGRRGEALPHSRCVMRHALISGSTGSGDQEWMERGDGTLIRVSWLVTPCRVDESATGALVIFHPAPDAEDGAAEPPWQNPSLSELERLALLAETTATLTSSLDVDATLRHLVRLVVPLLADWVVVDLVDEEGTISRAVVVHYENGTLTHRDDLQRQLPPVTEDSPMPLSRALRGVTATLISPQSYRMPPDTGIAVAQQDLLAQTGIKSACIAPIRGIREVIGALTLGRSERAQPYTAGDLLLVEDIARRAGLALDNARLYERQRRVAETMQRHLLPRLPVVSGLEMSACYVPAPDASQVGGDWYDAFTQAGGALGLVIGDVVGHDLDAAAGMAQVCNMLRAYAGEMDSLPSTVIGRLDQAVSRMAEATMATVVFARAEPVDGGWRLRWTNAGHPPPLLVERDGTTRFLEDGGGLMLGTGICVPRQDAVVDLPPHSSVVFYTDGLIESPSHSLDDGLERLRKEASALGARKLHGFCDRLLRKVRPDDNDDDVALLTLRVPG